MSEEFEVTLRICSEDPETVFRSIVTTHAVGSYELVYKERSSIHDRYFDFPDRTLADRGYALRLRIRERNQYVCLKGKEVINEWGGIRRLEIEGPWSEEILDRIAHTARDIRFKKEFFRPDDPLQTLESLGLQVIQARETVRTSLDVVFTGSVSRPVIGEMALDRVCYEIAQDRFFHYELEVEAAGEKDGVYLADFTASLKDAFPDRLCRWDYNKLVTGRAVEALIGQKRLSSAEKTGDLIPESWYAAIDEWAGKNKPGMQQADKDHPQPQDRE